MITLTIGKNQAILSSSSIYKLRIMITKCHSKAIEKNRILGRLEILDLKASKMYRVSSMKRYLNHVAISTMKTPKRVEKCN